MIDEHILIFLNMVSYYKFQKDAEIQHPFPRSKMVNRALFIYYNLYLPIHCSKTLRGFHQKWQYHPYLVGLTKKTQVLSLHAVLPGLGLLHPLGLGGHLWGPGSKSATGSQREDGGLRGDGAHHQRAGAGVERDPLSGGGPKGGRL